jgi:hypothetical protein
MSVRHLRAAPREAMAAGAEASGERFDRVVGARPTDEGG